MWSWSPSASRLSVSFITLLITIVCLCPARRTSAEVEVKPDPRIDERLFLTYVLHDLYSFWPTGASNPQRLEIELAEMRHVITRYHEYVKIRSFDPRLTSLFADCLEAMDAYTTFLALMGRIERETVARLEKERTEAVLNGVVKGGGIMARLNREGSSRDQAAFGGLAAGFVQGLIDDDSKGKARDEDMRAAIEAAGRKLRGTLSAIQARLEITEADLATKYGWNPQELRSSDIRTGMDRIGFLRIHNDTDGMLRAVEKGIVRRPRDAELLALREHIEALNAHATVSSMKARMQRCVAHASFVPPGKIYDCYRANILYRAADIANHRWVKELDGFSWGTANSSMAAYAVELWDAVLEYAPGDSDGECRERRAWALMASGRLNEAVKQANEVKKLRDNTLRYAINTARLMNATGDTAKAWEWFQHAVKNFGYNDIARARSDPDLAGMRQAHGMAFDDLVAVKADWGIQWGIVSDGIWIINTSAFSLTNVVLSGRIESGGRVWKPELKCDVVKPGETHHWPDVLSIPGNRIDRSSMTLSCDQNR